MIQNLAMDSEKNPNKFSTVDVYTGISSSIHVLDWTDDEERKIVRKIDCIVLLLLMLGFMALAYDRVNIGNALTDFFLEDVGITQDEYNIGMQLCSCGTVLLEIPSTMILFWLGPRLWLGGQMVAWSLVSLFQAFQKGLGPLLVIRLLLGLCESGFAPAALYTITLWYKKEETSKRFSWLYVGALVAAASSGLVAYGILQMRDIAGLTGWQWLFIVEGVFTTFVAIGFMALFPREPAHPTSFLGLRYFTERETVIMVQRVLQDDPSKQKNSNRVSKADLLSALGNWRIYGHLLMTICAAAPSSTLSSYAPSLVEDFGFVRLSANALVSVGNWILLVATITWGTMADKTKNRGLWVMGGLLLWWGSALGCLLVTYSTSSSMRYGLLIFAMSFRTVWHPIDESWLSLNARSAGERSITMAMINMSANLAGILGHQIFRAQDAPEYHRGWILIVGLISAGVLFCTVTNTQYRVLNRKQGRYCRDEEAEGVDGRTRYRL